MIKISPNTRDDPVDEMISPVTIDLRSSQIDIKVGLFDVTIMAEVTIRIVSISHFCCFWFTKPFFLWDVGGVLFVGFSCWFILFFFF